MLEKIIQIAVSPSFSSEDNMRVIGSDPDYLYALTSEGRIFYKPIKKNSVWTAVSLPDLNEKKE